jgi:hypothetical protein
MGKLNNPYNFKGATLPKIQPVPSTGEYAVAEGFAIDGLYIPAGFTTDGASIPRFFWRIVGHPFQSSCILAAVVHDWLYVTKKFTQKEADKLFYKLLKESGNSKVKSWLFYRAVRAFGWTKFTNRKKGK